MPYVRVQTVRGRTAEQKAAVAEAITHALVEHMGAVAEHVYVVFEDVAATDWVVGGLTVAERRRRRGERPD